MKKETTISILNFLYDHLTHVTIENEYFLPSKGPVIIAMNHTSWLDFPALLYLKRRNDIKVFAASRFKNVFPVNIICNNTGMIYIDRSTMDFTAIHQALNWIQEGKILALAPEGTNSNDGKLLKGKPGTILLAIKSGVSICPAGITGAEHVLQDYKNFKKPDLSIRFGTAYKIENTNDYNRKEYVEKCTTDLMCRIAALLPEQNRGYYMNNPLISKYLKS